MKGDREVGMGGSDCFVPAVMSFPSLSPVPLPTLLCLATGEKISTGSQLDDFIIKLGQKSEVALSWNLGRQAV